MTSADALLHEPWQDPGRQRQAYAFGMWCFLASEVLFFGALLFAYAVLRATHPAEVSAAARHADVVFGTANTVILMTSSLALAIAERAQLAGLHRLAAAGLWTTLALGLAFLAVKGFEYAKDLRGDLLPGADFALGASPAILFWGFYWIATAVHGVHVTIGLALIIRLILLARARRSRHAPSFEATSLYWHLVDIIWVVLYPLIYLVGRP
jgi:cytochrome c oxidase subunit 3